MGYLEAFLTVCLANRVSMMSCARVWEYMPGYVRDYVEFVRTKPYQKEKDYLKQIERS